MEENLKPNKDLNTEVRDNINNSEKKNLMDSKTDSIENQQKENYISTNSNDSKNIPVSKDEIKNDQVPLNKTITQQKKELPIEKKPFQEFINIHLIPSLIEEINQRGLEIDNINLKNAKRPIAGDKCWVINCEIKDICNFWLSFEKEDISSLKSISLSKPNQQPSIIESFLIDEKRITLKLIISRVLQRLNGQKLIGIN
tara:strand:- start:2 stop:598 length:597 start_codon:yes stop_codon:yes gene_type:complete